MTSLSSKSVIARIASASAGSTRFSPGAGAAGSRSGGTRTDWPSSSRVETSARLPSTRTSPLRTIFIEMRLRQVGKASSEPAVEPHPGLVLTDGVDGDIFGGGGGRRRFGFEGIAHARLLSQRRDGG